MQNVRLMLYMRSFPNKFRETPKKRDYDESLFEKLIFQCFPRLQFS